MVIGIIVKHCWTKNVLIINAFVGIMCLCVREHGFSVFLCVTKIVKCWRHELPVLPSLTGMHVWQKAAGMTQRDLSSRVPISADMYNYGVSVRYILTYINPVRCLWNCFTLILELWVSPTIVVEWIYLYAPRSPKVTLSVNSHLT